MRAKAGEIADGAAVGKGKAKVRALARAGRAAGQRGRAAERHKHAGAHHILRIGIDKLTESERVS